MDTTDKVGELEALLADLRTAPAYRFAGALEIRCANFMRNHGPELIRIYRAWQGAGVFGMHLLRDESGKCIGANFGTPSNPGTRVRLVPDGGDDGQGGAG